MREYTLVARRQVMLNVVEVVFSRLVCLIDPIVSAGRAFGTGSKGDPQRRAAPPFEFAPFENPPP